MLQDKIPFTRLKFVTGKRESEVSEWSRYLLFSMFFVRSFLCIEKLSMLKGTLSRCTK